MATCHAEKVWYPDLITQLIACSVTRSDELKAQDLGQQLLKGRPRTSGSQGYPTFHNTMAEAVKTAMEV